jgi:hypothetical protein
VTFEEMEHLEQPSAPTVTVGRVSLVDDHDESKPKNPAKTGDCDAKIRHSP